MKYLELTLEAQGSLEPLETAEPELFVPEGVCTKLIRFEVEDGRLKNVEFIKGCDGNLKAIATLVQGMELTDIISTLSGITCGKKSTSCADQLSKGLQRYLDGPQDEW